MKLLIVMKDFGPIIELFMSLTDKAAQTNKVKTDYGNNILLYRSEIHTIEIIGRTNGIHISEIAREMGVTKGAISQRMKVLKRKGLIEKIADPKNQSRVLVTLTEAGKICFSGHRKYHQKKDKEMFDYLNKLNKKETETIEAFLKKANRFVERHF